MKYLTHPKQLTARGQKAIFLRLYFTPHPQPHPTERIFSNFHKSPLNHSSLHRKDKKIVSLGHFSEIQLFEKVTIVQKVQKVEFLKNGPETQFYNISYAN